MSEFDYDLFVIGAGSGGVRLARMSAGMGAKVAVAENRYLGGTCVNVGCVPKKLFVYASHVQEDVEDGAGFGWSLDGALKFSWQTLRDNKNTEIARLNGIYKSLLDNSGASLFMGAARVVDAHTVEVNGQTFTTERICIATGSWPNVPVFEGAEHAITSNEFFFLESLPSTATVLGGGYIAIELAGILQGLGVQTTLVYRGESILRGFDNEVRQFVSSEVQKKGIRLVLQDNIKRIKKADNNAYAVTMDSGVEFETGMVIAAIGRSPLVEGLGLESLGVNQRDNAEIIVDEHYQTSIPSIYAIGDVTGGPQLTPVALAEGMYLARHFYASTKPKPVDYANIATAVFCQPNIATVGLTEEQANERGIAVEVFSSSFKPMKHTISKRDERSLMKLIVDKSNDKVIGAHMVGADAGEIIQGIAIAMKAGATKSDFDQTIGIHPTAAEEFVTMREPRA